MATHSSIFAWRIPGMGEPGGLPSVGSHRVRHDWSNLAAAAARSCGEFWTKRGTGFTFAFKMFPKAIQRKDRFEGSDENAEALGGWIFVQGHTAGKEWQSAPRHRGQTAKLRSPGLVSAWMHMGWHEPQPFCPHCYIVLRSVFSQSPKAAEVLTETKRVCGGCPSSFLALTLIQMFSGLRNPGTLRCRLPNPWLWAPSRNPMPRVLSPY